jgi:hypothetical protein
MMEPETLPDPAELLRIAQRCGVTIHATDEGGLRFSPSRQVTPELFYGARRVKPQLLALLKQTQQPSPGV